MDTNDQGASGVRGAPIPRRRFLQYSATSLAALAAAGTWRLQPAGAQRGQEPRGRTGPTPSLIATLRRREDQLRLDLEFYNLQLHPNARPARLVRQQPRHDAHVVVVFPPQHVMEQAGFEYDPDTQVVDPPPNQVNDDAIATEPLPNVPVGARLAAGTRLAFLVPESIKEIPYEVDALLTWDQWIPSLAPAADLSLPRSQRILAPPGPLHTAVELPWWLLLSPRAGAGWDHAIQPVERNGRTELWHTRFTGTQAQAIWTRDPDFADWLDADDATRNGELRPPDGEDFKGAIPIGMPFRTSLSPRDRYDLVVCTSDFRNLVSDESISGARWTPQPAEVERMMLTPLGGWLDLHGNWADQPDVFLAPTDSQESTAASSVGGVLTSGTSMESWRHIATMGRDQYVRIVRRGFLFPFGFAASLVKVTERKFRNAPVGLAGTQRVAYLMQRYFLIVRQRVVTYWGSNHPNEGRLWPFDRVHTNTLITPNLDPPGDNDPQGGFGGLQATRAFVPRVGGQPFLFHLVGRDHRNRLHDLHAPVVFIDALDAVDSDTMGDPESPGTVIADYLKLGVTNAARAIDLGGHDVTVAPLSPQDDPGATDLEIHRLTLGAEVPSGVSGPRFLPTLHEASVRLAAAEAILGGNADRPVVEFHPAYVADGFATAGEVFVRTVGNTSAGVDFSSSQAGDRSGGVITPNLAVTGLSRKTGPVAGNVDSYQGGSFNPSDFFGSLNPRLLGDISLADVVNEPATFDLSSDELLHLTTHARTDEIVTELAWRPKLRNVPNVGDDAALFISKAITGSPPSSLDVHALIVVPRDNPNGAELRITGDLRNFQVGLLPGARFIVVGFDRLRFVSETGKKTDVDVQIAKVEFAGPLEFVNQLRDYLNFSAGGFAIELQPSHLDASFTLPIPSITLGVFSLQNIAFTAGTMIPFTGQPVQFRFGFSTQENPFLLSVMIFGGGGFFELAVGPGGVDAFQAALEFGVVAAMDFGVAAGSVRLTAGIYLAIGVPSSANPDGKAELTGFLTIRGQVRVMGIITVTITMQAGFTYIPASKKALVKASIIVEVKVLIFGGEVEVEFQRKFGGSDDPTFGDTFSKADWDAYTDAFAPIGA